MRNTGESSEIVCANCRKPIRKEEVIWEITKHIKIIPEFKCETCGEIIQVEIDSERDIIGIKKECNCPLRIAKELLNSKVRWDKESFIYCNSCAKEVFPKVILNQL